MWPQDHYDALCNASMGDVLWATLGAAMLCGVPTAIVMGLIWWLA